MPTLAELVETYDTQLKFVVTGREDMAEIERLLERLRDAASTCVRDDDVLLMPEGQTRDQLEATRETVADLARSTATDTRRDSTSTSGTTHPAPDDLTDNR